MTETVKKFNTGALRFLRGLVAEQKGPAWEMSKGAVAFWVVLAHCVWKFTHGQSPVPEEMYLLYATMGYNATKHLRDGLAKRK